MIFISLFIVNKNLKTSNEQMSGEVEERFNKLRINNKRLESNIAIQNENIITLKQQLKQAMIEKESEISFIKNKLNEGKKYSVIILNIYLIEKQKVAKLDFELLTYKDECEKIKTKLVQH